MIKKTLQKEVLMNYLAVDIGGTFIKYSVLSGEGQVLKETSKVKTKIDDSQNYILDQVIEIVDAILEDYQLEGVAISSAGVINSDKGHVEYAGPTIPGFTDTPIATMIKDKFNIKCTVINDVNAACLGEYWKGFESGHKPKTMVCVTIGTGIGGAVIVNGKLHEGETYRAGEIGYIPIDGHYYQDLASTTALLNEVKQAFGKTLSGEQFFEELEKGSDEKYTLIFNRFVSNLAKGLLTIQYLLNPEIIVIGGGIMARHDLILPALKEEMSKTVVDDKFLAKSILPARAGNDAGMLGALYHHLYDV